MEGFWRLGAEGVDRERVLGVRTTQRALPWVLLSVSTLVSRAENTDTHTHNPPVLHMRREGITILKYGQMILHAHVYFPWETTRPNLTDLREGIVANAPPSGLLCHQREENF